MKFFRVILYSREGGSITETLKSNGLLVPYLDRIVTLPQPQGTETISSSVIREQLLSGENCQDMLCPGVWEIFKEFTPDDFPDVINQFKGEYDFLNNRFGCSFVWQGLQYGNAWAAFQSSKCEDESERKVHAGCSADKAALKGNEQIPFIVWEDARLDIMESILRAKFEQNPALMKKLTDTGNHILINGNNKQETYWGVDLYSWQGENHLGRIIMDIRDKEIQR